MKSIANINAIGLGLTLLGLSGCASFSSDDEQTAHVVQQAPEQKTGTICVAANGLVVDCALDEMEYNEFDDLQAEPVTDTHTLTATNSSVMLGEYVEQLATQLMETSVVPGDETVVGVTSFIEFGPELSSINLFGNLLAEEFIFQLQQNGIAVVDYKVMAGVQVQGNGDFVFSRNSQALDLANSMQHVLTGTTVYHTRGIMVNARIVHLISKRVVASAKRLIPYFVLDSIVPAGAKQSVMGNR